MGRLGEARLAAHGLSPFVLSALPATQASMGDCGPWDGAGEELLGAPLFGTAAGGSCPAQRDQATSTADLQGSGP